MGRNLGLGRMCEYQLLRVRGARPIEGTGCKRQQLKGLIENGDYRPEPELVARAMLRRRSVRELLVGPGAQRS